jgi:hypothetical protein
VPKFRLNIVFTGVDLDDDQVFEALAERSDILWRAQSDAAYATATIDAPSALKAAELVTNAVMELVRSAHPIRLDDDLVSIPDVASRVGVTREAVRNWANGTRQANFPLPRGVVGDGIKVWAWADVNSWLLENLSFGDAERFPTAHEAALINATFAEVRERQSLTALMAATWSVTGRVSTLTETLVKTRTAEPSTWVETARTRTTLSVLDTEDAHAAA